MQEYTQVVLQLTILVSFIVMKDIGYKTKFFMLLIFTFAGTFDLIIPTLLGFFK